MPRYWYTLEHRDEQGRSYAARFDFDQPTEARKAHRLSCDFLWVKPTMLDPLVSTLYASDGRTSVEIRPSCAPGQDPDRQYVEVEPPADVRQQLALDTTSVPSSRGRDMASSRDRAEAQPDDLGSSPSTSTSEELPF